MVENQSKVGSATITPTAAIPEAHVKITLSVPSEEVFQEINADRNRILPTR
jgi:hypothetical protein